MKHLETDRLLLVPCSLQMTEKILLDLNSLKKILCADIPEQWPTNELKSLIPYVIESLEKDSPEIGWGIWIVIDKCKKYVVGDARIKANSADCEVIEIGYGILPKCRNQGFATETADALVNWAFSIHESVMEIRAYCDKSNLGSMKVLKKINMTQVHETDGLQKWVLIRRRWHEGF